MTVTRATRRTAAATLALALPLALGALASSATADTPDQVDPPDTFTSAFFVDATPGNVIGPDNTTPSGGDPDGSGEFLFFINSDEEIICWDITTENVEPPYQSAAKTATHIHQTPAGTNGPPRIAFPNPEGPDGSDIRTSSGCSEGPFTTGLQANGQDTGTGFTLDQIEANPSGFSADTHTSSAVPGAVRGQLVFSQELLDQANGVDEEPGDDDGGVDDGAGAGGGDDDREVPVNGVDTGAGGTADGTSVAPYAALALVGAATAGAVALRRRQGA